MTATETSIIQYEAYPYPPRKAGDEKKRLVTGSPSEWIEVKHCLFGGAWAKDKPVSVLVAGGGTGDGLILLAQRLAEEGLSADIHYLDLSVASRAIAEARAKARGLENSITFHTGSLLEADRLSGAPFDYIDCCGVLHHLDDPVAGLKALRRALKPEGGMGLMVYAPYGRTGVYAAQAAFAALFGDEQPKEKVRLAKQAIKDLPVTNWLKRNPHVGDHVQAGDAGLYDLLLHATDQPFSVPDLMAFLAAGGMRLARWCSPLRYQPESYLVDPGLRKRADAMPPEAQWALAEKLAGNMGTHVFYAVPADRQGPVEALLDGAAVPVLREVDGAALAKALTPGQPLKVTIDGLPMSFPLPRLAPALFARVDGEKTVDALYADLRALDGKLTREDFDRQMARFVEVNSGLGKLFLKTG